MTYGKKMQTLTKNKVIIYNSTIKPICTYGNELCGYNYGWQPNVATMQRCQCKMLRRITNVPWYVANHTLLHDKTVQEVVQDNIAEYHRVLHEHPNLCGTTSRTCIQPKT